MPKTTTQLQNLIGIVSRLRQPDGCPWDIRQTPQTFKKYIIEEAYELLEAIDTDNADQIKEELGDLFFQLIFVNNLYEEKGCFTLDQVLETISAKMIRRHPHVFGDLQVSSEENLRRQWHAIKASEKDGTNENTSAPTNQLRSVPKALPALRRAHRVAERTARMGIDCSEAAELVTELGKRLPLGPEQQNLPAQEQEKLIGDFLFCLAIIARQGGNTLEDALQQSIDNLIDAVDRIPAKAGQPEHCATLRDLLGIPKND